MPVQTQRPESQLSIGQELMLTATDSSMHGLNYCRICLETKDENLICKLEECKHEFCVECLRDTVAF